MKTFLAAAALLLAANSFAQQKVFTLGVEGGISVASLNSDNETVNDIYESRTGYAAGFSFQYNFPKILSLRSGVMFELKGMTSDIILMDASLTQVNNGEWTQDLGYLTIPLMLRATFGNKINVFVQGGPYWATLVSAKIKYEPIPPNTETEIDVIEGYYKSEFGVSGGIGISSIFNNLIVISVEVRNNYGISNISNNVYETNNRSLLFLAGVGFTFGARAESGK
jgi:hypothetical protein